MTKSTLTSLQAELQTVQEFNATTPVQPITDAYNRILALVQTLMLQSSNPEGHVRAWNLVNEEAYKDLVEVQQGRLLALDDLKVKLRQVGHLLLTA